MDDIGFKEELKLLKEKIKKKNLRIKQLININNNLRELISGYHIECNELRHTHWILKKNFPQKYYRVEWSGVDENGKRLASKIEMKSGLCVAVVIDEIKNTYTKAIIHMIEEVA